MTQCVWLERQGAAWAAHSLEAGKTVVSGSLAALDCIFSVCSQMVSSGKRNIPGLSFMGLMHLLSEQAQRCGSVHQSCRSAAVMTSWL